jgi:hypothetical protein
MDALARDLLPPDIVGRSSKAYFNRVFFGDESHAFAAEWSGRGIDETLVDAEALRDEWLSEIPDFRTSMMLQSAWLADHQHEYELEFAQAYELEDERGPELELPWAA